MSESTALKGVRVDTGEVVEIGPAHPVADLFPLLAGEDLDELTASIQEQGLLQPVVLDQNGRVLDGRNRVAACEQVGLTPEVVVYDGDDPAGYALTVNIARRHLSKGQRAMLAARAVLVSGTRQVDAAQAIETSQQRISQANVVLRHAPELAGQVISGQIHLDGAYKTAQDRKRAADDAAAQLAKLRAEAPDLADLVAEERMKLSEAIGAHRARADQEQRERQQAIAGVRDGLATFTNAVPGLLALSPDARRWPVDLADLERAERAIAALKERLA